MRFTEILISVLLLFLSAGLVYGQTLDSDRACDILKADIKSGSEPGAALRNILSKKPEFCPMIRCALEVGIPHQAVQVAAQSTCVQNCAIARCVNSACRETEKLFETDQLCKAIKRDIEKGKEMYGLLFQNLRHGPQCDACKTIKCAVAAGADLETVIGAARDANLTDDVISRCCIDGCADPYRVAQILREYDSPLPPIDPGKPGYLSPSGF